MKKLLSVFLSFMMFLGVAGCQKAPEEPKVEEETAEASQQPSLKKELTPFMKMNGDVAASKHLLGDDNKEEAKDDKSSSSSKLTKEVQDVLKQLQTDYSKVKWGAEYSLFEDYPGFVASVSLYNDGLSYYLVVGFTNLYDVDVQFAGNLDAYNQDGKVIGSSSVYEAAIGTGSTVIETIYCGKEMPDGRIQYTDCELNNAVLEYVPWSLKYDGNIHDDALEISYEIQEVDKKELPDTLVTFLILDKDGFILGAATDYTMKANAGSTYSGQCVGYVAKDAAKDVKSLAVFTNPVK